MNNKNLIDQIITDIDTSIKLNGGTTEHLYSTNTVAYHTTVKRYISNKDIKIYIITAEMYRYKQENNFGNQDNITYSSFVKDVAGVYLRRQYNVSNPEYLGLFTDITRSFTITKFCQDLWLYIEENGLQQEYKPDHIQYLFKLDTTVKHNKSDFTLDQEFSTYLDAYINENSGNLVTNASDFNQSFDTLLPQVSIGQKDQFINRGDLIVGDLLFSVPPSAIEYRSSRRSYSIPTMRTNGSPVSTDITALPTIHIDLYFTGQQAINDQLRPLFAQYKRAPFTTLVNATVYTLVRGELLKEGEALSYHISDSDKVSPIPVVLKDLHFQTAPGYPDTLQAQLTLGLLAPPDPTKGLQFFETFSAAVASALYETARYSKAFKLIDTTRQQDMTVRDKQGNFYKVKNPVEIEPVPYAHESQVYRQFYRSILRENINTQSQWPAAANTWPRYEKQATLVFKTYKLKRKTPHAACLDTHFNLTDQIGTLQVMLDIIQSDNVDGLEDIKNKTKTKIGKDAFKSLLLLGSSQFLNNLLLIQSAITDNASVFNETLITHTNNLKKEGIELDFNVKYYSNSGAIKGTQDNEFYSGYTTLLGNFRKQVEAATNLDLEQETDINVIIEALHKAVRQDNNQELPTIARTILALNQDLKTLVDNELQDTPKSRYEAFKNDFTQEVIIAFNKEQDVIRQTDEQLKVDVADGVNALSVSYNNHVVPLPMDGYDLPKYQHTSIANATVGFTFRTNHEDTLAVFREIEQSINTINKQAVSYSEYFNLANVQLVTEDQSNNSLLHSLGINRLVFQSLDIRTIKGHPGWYEIHISMIENNTSLRQAQRIRLAGKETASGQSIKTAYSYLLDFPKVSFNTSVYSEFQTYVNNWSALYKTYNENKTQLQDDPAARHIRSEWDEIQASEDSFEDIMLRRYLNKIDNARINKQEVYYKYKDGKVTGGFTTIETGHQFTRDLYTTILQPYFEKTSQILTDYIDYETALQGEQFNFNKLLVPGSTYHLLITTFKRYAYAITNGIYVYVSTTTKGINIPKLLDITSISAHLEDNAMAAVRTGLLSAVQDILTVVAGNNRFLAFIKRKSGDSEYNAWRALKEALQVHTEDNYPGFNLPPVKITSHNHYLLHPGFYFYAYEKPEENSLYEKYKQAASQRLLISTVMEMLQGEKIYDEIINSPQKDLICKTLGSCLKQMHVKHEAGQSLLKITEDLVGDKANLDKEDSAVGQAMLDQIKKYTEDIQSYYRSVSEKEGTTAAQAKRSIPKLLAAVKVMVATKAVVATTGKVPTVLQELKKNGVKTIRDEKERNQVIQIIDALSVGGTNEKINRASENSLAGDDEDDDREDIYSLTSLHKMMLDAARYLEWAEHADDDGRMETFGYTSQNSALLRVELIDKIMDAKEQDIQNRPVSMFPTFKFFIIEEDAANWRFYDDFYSYDGVNSIDIVDSKRSASQTASIQLSNTTNLLTRGISDIIQEHKSEDQPAFSAEEMKLQEGTPVLIKLGYGADHKALMTKLQGSITGIQEGPVLSVTAQSWGAEMLNPVSVDIGATHPVKTVTGVLTYVLGELAGMSHFGKFGLRNFYESDGSIDDATKRQLYSAKWLTWALKTVVPKIQQMFNSGTDLTDQLTNIHNFYATVNKESTQLNINDSNLMSFLNSPLMDNIQVNTGSNTKPGFVADILKLAEPGPFDWKNFEEPVWDILWEIALHLGDYIVRAYNYNDGCDLNSDIRQTLYFGPHQGYYKNEDSVRITDPQLLEDLLASPTVADGRNIEDNIIESYINQLSIDLEDAIIQALMRRNVLLEINKIATKPQAKRYYDMGIIEDFTALGKSITAILINKGHTYLGKAIDHTTRYLYKPGKDSLNISIRSFLGLMSFNDNISHYTNKPIQNAGFFRIEDKPTWYHGNTINPLFTREEIKEAAYQYQVASVNPGKRGALTPEQQEFKEFYGICRADNFTPVVKHHALTSLTNLVRNEMIVDANNMYNKVNILFPNEPTLDMERAAQKGRINKFSAQISMLQDPEYLKVYNSYQKNIDPNWFVNWNVGKDLAQALEDADGEDIDLREYMPNYALIAQRILNNTVKTMYSGYIHSVGNPQVEPWHILHVMDPVNDIYGPVEVEQAVQHLSINRGYTTSYMPNLVTHPRDLNNSIDTLFMANWNKARIWSGIMDVTGASLSGLGIGVFGTMVGAFWPIFGATTVLVSAYNWIQSSYKAKTRLIELALGSGRLDIIPLIKNGKAWTAGMEGITSDDVNMIDVFYDTYEEVVRMKRPMSDATYLLGLGEEK